MRKFFFYIFTVCVIMLSVNEILKSGLISRPHTYVDGTIVDAGDQNDNENTIYNAFNGNIDNANIKAGAGITDNKLATITTAGKVNSSALTGTDWTDLTDGGITVLHDHAFGPITHGDLSATTTPMHSASSVIVFDPESRFTATNTEGVLAEIDTEVSALSSSAMKVCSGVTWHTRTLNFTTMTFSGGTGSPDAFSDSPLCPAGVCVETAYCSATSTPFINIPHAVVSGYAHRFQAYGYDQDGFNYGVMSVATNTLTVSCQAIEHSGEPPGSELRTSDWCHFMVIGN